MARRKRSIPSSLPLPMAFAGAVALHAAGFGLLAAASADEERPTPLRLEVSPDEVRTAPSPAPPEITLGIDAPTPSSLTWIGYDQFEEHLAQLSEVEQAAFSDDPAAGAGGEEPGDAETAAPAEPLPPDEPPPTVEPALAEAVPNEAAPVEPSPNEPSPNEPSTQAPSASEVKPDEPPGEASAETIEPTAAEASTPTELERDVAAPSAPDPVEQPDEAAPPQELDQPSQPPTMPETSVGPAPPPLLATSRDVEEALLLPVTQELLESWMISRVAVETPGALPAEAEALPASPEAPEKPGIAPPVGAAEETPSAATPAAPSPTPAASAAASADTRAPTTPAAAASPPVPVPPARPAPGPPVNRARGDGEQADRESDPSSVVDVPPDQWKRGKPLATHGVEIRTRRPVFPELTRVTSMAGNPVVVIEFNSAGRPVRADVLRSSGDPRVDGPVIDALYRWRASGKALEKLGEGETLRIEMRILLVGG